MEETTETTETIELMAQEMLGETIDVTTATIIGETDTEGMTIGETITPAMIRGETTTEETIT